MGGLGGGGGIPIPVGGGIGGIIITIIIIVVLNLLGGQSLGGSVGGLGGEQGGGGALASLDPNDTSGQFVNAVTVDVQGFWSDRFQAAGKTYTTTRTVLFTDLTQSGCGVASPATGPWYCPSATYAYADRA